MFPSLPHHESRLDVVHPSPVCPSNQEVVGSSDHQIQQKKSHRVLSVAVGWHTGDLYDELGCVE